MAKSLTLGNGTFLVCLDRNAQVRDLYFPYVGLENHIGGRFVHRVGVWVDGTLHWLDDRAWSVSVASEDDALAGKTTARNDRLGVELVLHDIVYNEKNIFLRKVTVKNLSGNKRTIKVFFGHEFEIYQSHRGDTAYYDPRGDVIVHYNGKRVFMISAICDDRKFDDYTTGEFSIQGKEGSYRDAEDGVLSRNPIEHGPTDSVIGFYRVFEPNEEKHIYYWLSAAESIQEARSLSDYVLHRTPEHLLNSTFDFWNAWVHKEQFNFHDLEERVVKLFKKSLFIIRAHSDNQGAIIASGDSDMLQGGKDTYSYMWPRDASFSAIALDMAGDANVSQRYFRFCNEHISDGGYFMHKYRPDGSLGSSWHPWVVGDQVRLPIQEDETALVIYALWKHYEKSHDLEFVEGIYNSLIKKAADFMVLFRDEETRLPNPSYDLWEEKFGTSTFTAATVYGGLYAASNFAELLGKKRSASYYREIAEEIREAILVHLYDKESGVFYKLIGKNKNGTKMIDKTIDISSVYGLFAFGVLEPHDPKLEKAMALTQKRLNCPPSGGLARYEGDRFYRLNDTYLGNPWIITTLWLAQYYIAKAKDANDFTVAKGWLAWAADHAMRSGVLSEQLNPMTGEQISASPLTWSHAEFVRTVIQYLDRLEELGLCVECDPLYTPKSVAHT